MTPEELRTLNDRDSVRKAGFTVESQYPEHYWTAKRTFRPGYSLMIFFDDWKPGECSVYADWNGGCHRLPDWLIETTEDLEWLVKRMGRVDGRGGE